MTMATTACARCATANHPANRFCDACGLPLGGVQADAGAMFDVFGPYEVPDPAEPDAERAIRELVACSGFNAALFGPGWRLVVPLQPDRHQSVYLGPAGTDPDGRAALSPVSVCGPANDREARTLLKLNAQVLEGHFAIRVLRGEEYFVVVRTLTADSVPYADAALLVRRIAQAADGLEDRLSRGRDLY